MLDWMSTCCRKPIIRCHEWPASMWYACSGCGEACLPESAERCGSGVPGCRLVGEHGPELVHFDGGERVVPAP